MGDVPPSEERLCWRSWPCPACRHGLTPIGHLIRRRETSAGDRPTDIEAVIAWEIAVLQRWIATCDHAGEVVEFLPKIGEGSEHVVYLDAPKAKVIKLTKQGIYGEHYFLEQGRMAQKNCSPIEYLIRLRLWKHVFGSAPQSLGLTANGQMVSRHHFITGDAPSQEEADGFLIQAGFKPVRQKYWLWEKAYPGERNAIGLGDAREDNFIKSEFGIVPVDLRLWLYPQERSMESSS